MNDVSKLKSGPSGAPLEMVLDGARMEDSNDASVSSAHWEGCKEGVGLTGGSCGDSDEMVIVGVRCGAREGGEISVSGCSLGVSTSRDLSISDSVSTMVLAFCPQRHSAVPKSVEASLRQTSQVSKFVLASVTDFDGTKMSGLLPYHLRLLR